MSNSMAFAFSSVASRSSSSPRILLHSSNFHLRLLKTTTKQVQQQARFNNSSIQVPRSISLQFSLRNVNKTHTLFSFPITTTTAPYNKQFHRLFFGTNDPPRNFTWNHASNKRVFTVDDGDGESSDLVKNDDEKPEIAVVILGWLGAKPKHLRRYVELYNAKGIHAITFVASVSDVLSFDLGKRLEIRVRNLTKELVSWVSDDGGESYRSKERFLLFHTFSNTGWLAYGAILNNLKERQDLMVRIKGCVVDSGGDPNIDPKVWAAGFTTALLKKSSSSAKPLINQSESVSKIEENEPPMIENLLMFAFEKFFSYLLFLPDVNQKLTKIITTLSENQPPCPQLYLYSTQDKVIPFQAVESFIEKQRGTGKQVYAYNFGSSPHVDHYRMFTDDYASQLYSFLKECFTMARKH